jgi:hypothetical protein
VVLPGFWSHGRLPAAASSAAAARRRAHAKPRACRRPGTLGGGHRGGPRQRILCLRSERQQPPAHHQRWHPWTRSALSWLMVQTPSILRASVHCRANCSSTVQSQGGLSSEMCTHQTLGGQVARWRRGGGHGATRFCRRWCAFSRTSSSYRPALTRTARTLSTTALSASRSGTTSGSPPRSCRHIPCHIPNADSHCLAKSLNASEVDAGNTCAHHVLMSRLKEMLRSSKGMNVEGE